MHRISSQIVNFKRVGGGCWCWNHDGIHIRWFSSKRYEHFRKPMKESYTKKQFGNLRWVKIIIGFKGNILTHLVWCLNKRVSYAQCNIPGFWKIFFSPIICYLRRFLFCQSCLTGKRKSNILSISAISQPSISQSNYFF